MDIGTAINSLQPMAEYAIRDGVIDWFTPDITQPTDAEISVEIIRLQAAYDAQAYARSRKAAYDLLNQNEMRYDDLINSTTTWQDAIAAIKTEYPK